MAEDSNRWHVQPAWKAVIATLAGLALTGIALIWPAMVWGNSPPVITQVQVTSSKGAFFYSLPLSTAGGTVYFNNLGGQGAGQIITVTVTVSDDNPSSFSGGFAFGITPTTHISTSYGTTSTWSLTYTVQAAHGSENGVRFVIADGNNLTDTATITFTQDITAPVIDFVDVTDPQWDSNADETDSLGNWYRTTLLDAGWSFTATISETGAGHDGGVARWDRTNNSYDQTLPSGDGRGTFTQVVTNPDGLVAVSLRITDRVGNVGLGEMSIRLDTTPPNLSSLSFSLLADADSGADGIHPNVQYYDDPTIDLRWFVPSDGPGSGAHLYVLSTYSLPFTSAIYTSDQPSGMLTGTLNVVTDQTNNIVITVTDHVGNVSPDFKVTQHFTVDTDAPANGKIDVAGGDGQAYLYINPWEGITTGTLYYNNAAHSSFGVTAGTGGPIDWGNSGPWYVEFDDSWGEPTTKDYSRPYFDIYDIAQSEVDEDGAFGVRFVNNAGNVQAITIAAILDTQSPQLVFTDVTDPDYDPDGDELNAAGNWYRTSALTAGWAFRAAITETGAGYEAGIATWNHQSNDDNDQTIVPALIGSHVLTGTFSDVYTDSDGIVQVTVTVTDRVNNVSSIALETQLDGTPPSISANPWDESSDYLKLQGDVLYFNAAMPGVQTAIVRGSAADGPGSGLDYAAFEQKANLTSLPVTQVITGNWFSHYGFTSATGVGPGAVDVTIYDHVGNPVTWTYEYIGVSEQPLVAFKQVTEAGYDAPPDNPLDDFGNWYARGNLDAPPNNSSWWFSAVITPANNMDILATRATWEHAAGPLYFRSITPVRNSNIVTGTFQNVRDDPSGLVTVTLTITDALNRVATDVLPIRIDKDGPAISGDGWSENSDYLYAAGSTLFFSHKMGTTQQVATLAGHADDGFNGAGSSLVTFSFPESLGSSLPNPGLPDWSIQYLVTSAGADSQSPVQVTVEDNLANKTTRTYAYVLDTTAPTTPTNFTITTLPVIPGYYNTRSLDVSWSPTNDNVGGSGLSGYYLGVSNPPPGFYLPTVTVTSFDVGVDGVFSVYLQAKDRVSNASLTSTGPITVDTQGPASYVTASPEEAEQRFLVQWGADDLVTWPVDYDVQYRVNGGDWTPWLSATTVISQYFGPSVPVPVEIDVLYEFQVQARDYLGNQGAWSPPMGGALGQRFVYLPVVFKNLDTSIPFAVFDGFETGAFVGWKTGGALSQAIVPHPVSPPAGAPPNGGVYAARLGSPGYGCGDQGGVPVGQAFVQAYASVPAGGSPYLRFDYRVLSYDSVRDQHGEWWDRLEVQVNGTRLPDENGSSLGNSNPYGDPALGPLNCSSLYDSGWKEGKINLSAYAGQTVILTFFNENHKDGYWNTYSYLDNIRIQVAP